MIVINEKCHICGKKSKFQIGDNATLFRDATCEFCGATIRTSDVAKAILDNFGNQGNSLKEVELDLPVNNVLNACTSGYVHEYMKFYMGYRAGEFFDGVKSGEYKDGVMCIDFCNIPFEDNTFDLIVAEDVFEHIKDYKKALEEVHRVLNKNGIFVCTVPIHENKMTHSREGMPEVYHGDPIRNDGCLVCTDFGLDIADAFQTDGLLFELKRYHTFYNAEDITDVDTSYEEYQQKRESLETYFKYNSNVIVMKKTDGIHKRNEMTLEQKYNELVRINGEYRAKVSMLNETIKYKDEELDRRLVELENRMTLINELRQGILR